jgi:hypothetical protein
VGGSWTAACGRPRGCAAPAKGPLEAAGFRIPAHDATATGFDDCGIGAPARAPPRGDPPPADGALAIPARAPNAVP